MFGGGVPWGGRGVAAICCPSSPSSTRLYFGRCFGVIPLVNYQATPNYQQLRERLQPLRAQLLSHPVYSAVHQLDDLKVFLSHHVFAVWDFMSLLKALQRSLTCLDDVWVPQGDRVARRLVNEIVLAEESDEVGGGFSSHFEMYLEAMRQVGCDPRNIDRLLGLLAAGNDVMESLDEMPEAVRDFSQTTFTIVREGSLPAIAAAFTLGREDIIPDMFRSLVCDLQGNGDADTSVLQSYLNRHIELDGDHHGPMAAHLLATICGVDEHKWTAAEVAATTSIKARIKLWDSVVESLSADCGTSSG